MCGSHLEYNESSVFTMEINIMLSVAPMEITYKMAAFITMEIYV